MLWNSEQNYIKMKFLVSAPKAFKNLARQNIKHRQQWNNCIVFNSLIVYIINRLCWGIKGSSYRLSDQRKAKTFFKTLIGTSLVVQSLRLTVQGVQVWSLVRELTSHMPHVQKNWSNIKQKQYCNKFNKEFKKWFTLKKKTKNLKK